VRIFFKYLFSFLVLTKTFFASGFLPQPLPGALEVYPLKPWEKAKILHIGDSHLQNWGLQKTLGQHFYKNGATSYKAVAQKGSNSRSWMVSGKLERLLKKNAPDLVLITLGTNAQKHPEPKSYARWISAVAQKVQPGTCYWIGPPVFPEERAEFYEILKEASKPCFFFDSRSIDFERTGKNYHLSQKQAQKWADHIWEWIKEH
jgi:lysophospholipase L1-like esterase